MNKVMFTLHWIALAPARKPYQIGLLFKHKKGDLGAISAKERGYAVPISKVEGHISDRCSYYSLDYSATPLHGHPLDTDTSLLCTVCFVPRERKPIHFQLP